MTVGWAGAGRARHARGRKRHWRGALGSMQQARGHGTDARGRAAALERSGRAGGRRPERQARGAAGRAEHAGQGWLGGLGAAWARELAKGCALVALGLFSARFDSVFFLSQIFGHCS